jgi:hypothetical protein
MKGLRQIIKFLKLYGPRATIWTRNHDVLLMQLNTHVTCWTVPPYRHQTSWSSASYTRGLEFNFRHRNQLSWLRILSVLVPEAKCGSSALSRPRSPASLSFSSHYVFSILSFYASESVFNIMKNNVKCWNGSIDGVWIGNWIYWTLPDRYYKKLERCR